MLASRIVLGLVLLPALGWTERARACSPDTCSPAWVRPADGATVPANLLVIEYATANDRSLFNGDGGLSRDAQMQAFQLLTQSGEIVPVTLSAQVAPGTSDETGVYLVAPVTRLSSGTTYRVQFPRGFDCDHTGTFDTDMVEQSFSTGPAVVLPTKIGSASQVGHEVSLLEVPTSSGSCTTMITAAIAHVEINPTTELRAYLPLTRLTAYVDGEWITQVRPESPVERVGLDVYAGCVVDDPGAYAGIAPGKHRLELRVQVLGQTTPPPPIWTDIHLDCPAMTADGGKARDGGAPTDASVKPASLPRAHGGGCAVATPAPGSGRALVLLLFGPAGIAWGRRRRG